MTNRMTNTSDRDLPALLREAERRVNQHVWGDRRAIVSIPALPDKDVDLLLMQAADEIERLRMALERIAQEPCEYGGGMPTDCENGPTAPTFCSTCFARSVPSGVADEPFDRLPDLIGNALQDKVHEDTGAVRPGRAVKASVPPHTTEDDFQHFLSYSGKRGQNEDELRLAYYAGADDE